MERGSVLIACNLGTMPYTLAATPERSGDIGPVLAWRELAGEAWRVDAGNAVVFERGRAVPDSLEEFVRTDPRRMSSRRS